MTDGDERSERIATISTRSWVICSVAGLLGLVLTSRTNDTVSLSDQLWLGTVTGCVGGAALGIALALRPYADAVSPWFVVGHLLYALAAGVLAGIAMWVRLIDPDGDLVVWVVGWIGLGLSIGFLAVALPSKARSLAQSQDP